MPVELEVLSDAGALADTAAERVVVAASDAIRARGRFVVAFAGGSTPRATYLRLAADPMASRVTWSKVHVTWGDERCVPPDRAESNYRMARETLFDHVPIPAGNVHRIQGESDPTEAAARYEGTLRALFQTPAGPPRADPGARMDLVLLGLGVDGHTASLFPGSAAVQEQARWVVATPGTATPLWRVTMTPALINASAQVLFLVEGRAKAGVLRQVLEGPRRPAELPAQLIAPSNGRVRWLVDGAAAADLEKP